MTTKSGSQLEQHIYDFWCISSGWYQRPKGVIFIDIHHVIEETAALLNDVEEDFQRCPSNGHHRILGRVQALRDEVVAGRRKPKSKRTT